MGFVELCSLIILFLSTVPLACLSLVVAISRPDLYLYHSANCGLGRGALIVEVHSAEQIYTCLVWFPCGPNP